MSCLNCIELAEQLADLKAEVARARAGRYDQAHRIGEHFGLARQDATALAALYNAEGRILTKDQVDEALPETADGLARTWARLDVLIHHIRQKTGYAAITTHRTIGWSITDAGRQLVDQALESRGRAA